MAEFLAEREFEEKIVQVNRVSKKTAGGNKIGFSVLVVVGDKNGRVGVGLGKAPAVQDAIRKGVSYAKKHLILVPMVGTTIPHEIYVKRGAAKVLLKPASKGTGVIAGGAVRAVVEAAGVKDILSKVLGTSNQASNVYASLEALKKLQVVEKPREASKSVESVKDMKEKEIKPEKQIAKRVAKEKLATKKAEPKKAKTLAKKKK
ncbi:MAG: 30S ribosomal protein S5 [Candidatus Woykebacteria bacterium GWB1_45_5]|uniref:Small ribosomal subunit protein uS5 n=2 Tax=Candidatus Woykeibacteriota TaxID=1817899 RepID=A0A1G1W3D8_9BACT|nr:MAG: 30S ribosomal protein S5 [Candidatus Woykebacteria bacterium GWA1_44_8]OGY23316.1 MAG: 30S ribosomal protein S5 [Candidatus Woykebacteria bacterium GWB1_45_5]